jgi:hypothetical protein
MASFKDGDSPGVDITFLACSGQRAACEGYDATASAHEPVRKSPRRTREGGTRYASQPLAAARGSASAPVRAGEHAASSSRAPLDAERARRATHTARRLRPRCDGRGGGHAFGSGTALRSIICRLVPMSQLQRCPLHRRPRRSLASHVLHVDDGQRLRGRPVQDVSAEREAAPVCAACSASGNAGVAAKRGTHGRGSPRSAPHC